MKSSTAGHYPSIFETLIGKMTNEFVTENKILLSNYCREQRTGAIEARGNIQEQIIEVTNKLILLQNTESFLNRVIKTSEEILDKVLGESVK